MLKPPFGLTARECEVLRLLARGHDAKSAAGSLGLSVHTVNERLREARLKTGSSSSRGAARLLAEREAPEFLVPENLGVPAKAPPVEKSGPLPPGAPAGSRSASRWGVPVMASAILAAAILVVLGGAPETPPIDPHPKVVSTMPRAGEIVGAGPITISVTYDRPMRRKSYSFVRKSADTYPDCGASQPAQSADGRTFTMRCAVAPRRRYEVWFNDPPYLNFASEGGQPAVPFGLRFGTR